jgi:hypothetical protein
MAILVVWSHQGHQVRSGGGEQGMPIFFAPEPIAVETILYGEMVDAQPTAGAPTNSVNSRVSQLPLHCSCRFKQLTIYKFSPISLSASLLPVAAAQTTWFRSSCDGEYYRQAPARCLGRLSSSCRGIVRSIGQIVRFVCGRCGGLLCRGASVRNQCGDSC